jgi:hypothetical protein
MQTRASKATVTNEVTSRESQISQHGLRGPHDSAREGAVVT